MSILFINYDLVFVLNFRLIFIYKFVLLRIIKNDEELRLENLKERFFFFNFRWVILDEWRDILIIIGFF